MISIDYRQLEVISQLQPLLEFLANPKKYEELLKKNTEILYDINSKIEVYNTLEKVSIKAKKLEEDKTLFLKEKEEWALSKETELKESAFLYESKKKEYSEKEKEIEKKLSELVSIREDISKIKEETKKEKESLSNYEKELGKRKDDLDKKEQELFLKAEKLKQILG